MNLLQLTTERQSNGLLKRRVVRVWPLRYEVVKEGRDRQRTLSFDPTFW